MDRLPNELLIIIAKHCSPYDSFRLSRCCRKLYETLIHFCYKSFADSESLYECIIDFGRRDSQNATISALDKAQKAGAPKFTSCLYPMSISYTKLSWGWRMGSIQSRFMPFQCTLLGLAVHQGLEDVVTFLCESGVPIDLVPEPYRQDPTPLFIALAKRKHAVATRLLDLGACPAPYKNSITAFHLAVAAGYPNLIRFVEQLGMDANVCDGERNGPLAYVLYSQQETAQTVLQLSQLGAEMNQTCFLSGRRRSLLSIACMFKKWSLAKELLDCGADPDGHGVADRPLEIVCTQFAKGLETEERCVLITKLLEKGANPNLRKRMPRTGDHSSLFAYLIADNRQKEAECLLRCPQLNLEEVDSQNKTALSYALSTKSGCLPLAELLLQEGACLPTILIHDIAHLARQIYKAPISRKNKLLAEHRDFKRVCWVICQYASCCPEIIDKTVVNLLKKFKMNPKK